MRVRFAGRLVDGVVLDRLADTEHPGRLAPLSALVSPEPVLRPEIARLCRTVADRCAGTLWDVLRLALPPRHARVEAEPAAPSAPGPLPAPDPGPWRRYPTGPAYLAALADGRSPRAVWSALPGPAWPEEVALAVRACAASGRGALVVVPDARDLDRVAACLAGLPLAVLRADAGPAPRYRAFLQVLRGSARVALGTRAAAFAPVADLGLVVLWDDGDDSHAEPRAPYPHARDVLALRAHTSGAAALFAGHARTAEGQRLVESGWARSVTAPRQQVRAAAPRVDGVGDAELARDPLARAARLPAVAFAAAREALAADAPVLVQVPRRGGAPALACAADRTSARCASCAGPLGTGPRAGSVPTCRWCGRSAGDWQCPRCAGTALRAVVVGAGRTAEELGRAFPGVSVVTSGREEVLATVPGRAALVVSTPGAEPVAAGGYGAVLLLDAWLALSRPDLRAGEETLRRWLAAGALARPAGDAGRVVVVADPALPVVQALLRWNPERAAERELAERGALGFPPAARLAAVDGAPAAVAEVAVALEGFELLGPVPARDGERLLVRVPRTRSGELAAALKAVLAVRSARKAEPVRVRLDPQEVG